MKNLNLLLLTALGLLIMQSCQWDKEDTLSPTPTVEPPKPLVIDTIPIKAGYRWDYDTDYILICTENGDTTEFKEHDFVYFSEVLSDSILEDGTKGFAITEGRNLRSNNLVFRFFDDEGYKQPCSIPDFFKKKNEYPIINALIYKWPMDKHSEWFYINDAIEDLEMKWYKWVDGEETITAMGKEHRCLVVRDSLSLQDGVLIITNSQYVGELGIIKHIHEERTFQNSEDLEYTSHSTNIHTLREINF